MSEPSPLSQSAPATGWADFGRVRQLAEAACEEAIRLKLKCCANFGDLHCTEVCRVERDDGNRWWLVDIEEAAPDDYALQSFVRDKLALEGIPAEVRTEW